MSTIIKAKRSSVQGKVPLVADLELGEFAINTYDGKLFLKKNVGGTESIVEIGSGNSAADQTIILDTFTGNGSNTAFTLSTRPAADKTSFVFVNGVAQADAEYSIAGTTLTFSEAPASGDNIEVRTFKQYIASINLRSYHSFQFTIVANTTVTGTDDNGVNLVYDVGYIEVYLNGVRLLDTTDYIATNGTSVVLNEAASGVVEVVSLSAATFIQSLIADNSTALSTTTANQVVDTFGVGEYRSAKYIVQMTYSTSYHVTEVMIIHDGTDVYISEYGTIITGSSLGTITGSISGGLVRLQVSPSNINTTVKVVRLSVSA